jgi:TonB family protein
LAAWVSFGYAQRLEPSLRQRVTQNETAPSNAPTAPGSTNKTTPAPTPSPPEITKWQQSLVAHLARFKKYPAQGGATQGVVSLAFTLDRKGNVVSSRIEKSSGSTVLDDEALAMVKPLSNGQLIKQLLSFFQIERVKSLSEPAVDRSEKLASLIPFALIAPETGEAGACV